MGTRAGGLKSLKNLKPAKKGEIRNPRGRTTLGAYNKELLNAWKDKQLSAKQLRKIRDDEDRSFADRGAAAQALRQMEVPDLALFESYLDGSKSLTDLKAEGIDTTIVKKVKAKAFTDKDGNTEVTREIELHDRAGVELERVNNRTDGIPTQAIKVEAVLPNEFRIVLPTIAPDRI